MNRSADLFKRAKMLVPGGVNSPVRAFDPNPFFTKQANGSRITDVDGNEYIDYCMGFGPLIFGHAHSKIVEAIKTQIEFGALFGTPTEQEVDLAELISEVVPSAEMVRLVSTGGEATMAAIRAARGFTGKNKIIKFEGCYHGAHDSVLVKAGSGATTFGLPDSLGIPEGTTRNTIVIPFNDLDKIEKTMKANKDDLAAVIVEPVIGNMGVVLPKPGFLKTVRELTETYSVVLIFDEVITGFRLALGGAQEYFGIVPDLTTLGKILGGGLPLAAFVGKKEIMRSVAPSGKVYQAGTFSGNPLSVSAGLATVSLLKEKGREFYTKLEGKCKSIVNPLAEMISDCGFNLQINHIGSMFQLFFTDGPVFDYSTAKASDKDKFMEFHGKLLRKGVFLPGSQFETCFLSEAHTLEELKKTIECFSDALSQLEWCSKNPSES